MKRYRPDFPALMRLYEMNFICLRRLLPACGGVGQAVCYQVAAYQYQVRIVESTGYTTLVMIEQLMPEMRFWRLPSMTVRLYHDAQVAEVCASQQISRFKPRYDYPNPGLHQRDEKQQINQFLADWLRHCLVAGVGAIVS